MACALPPLTRVRRPLPGPGSPRRFSAPPPMRAPPAQPRLPRPCPLTPASLHVRHPSPISRARRARLPRRSSASPATRPAPAEPRRPRPSPLTPASPGRRSILPPLTRARRPAPPPVQRPSNHARPRAAPAPAPMASRARLPAVAAPRPPRTPAPRAYAGAEAWPTREAPLHRSVAPQGSPFHDRPVPRHPRQRCRRSGRRCGSGFPCRDDRSLAPGPLAKNSKQGIPARHGSDGGIRSCVVPAHGPGISRPEAPRLKPWLRRWRHFSARPSGKAVGRHLRQARRRRRGLGLCHKPH